jgi:hypothetical protein
MTTQVEQTLNVTVAQIEDAMLAGQTVPDFAREWSEPPANVLAIFRRLQDEGRIPRNGPAQVATTPKTRPLASVPMEPTTGTGPALSVDALVNAAARSESKRTQALGIKLADLATVVRGRLAEERAAAEKAEHQRAERDAAAAEVARLEEQLRAARAKLRPVRQGGVRSMPQREPQPRSTRGVDLKLPCREGCERTFPNAQGRGAHEKRTHGGAS